MLHLSQYEAIQWCSRVGLELGNLWVREMNLRDNINKHAAKSLERMMKDGRRTEDPHLKRAQELRDGDCKLTQDLMDFVMRMKNMLKGESQSLFKGDLMNPDNARSWLAEKRKHLMRKIRRENLYRDSCPYPDKNSATEKETEMQQEVVLLLSELLKSYPPLQVKKPKVKEG